MNAMTLRTALLLILGAISALTGVLVGVIAAGGLLPGPHSGQARVYAVDPDWARQPIDNAMNVVFVADVGYGDLSQADNRDSFLDDVRKLIRNGFMQNDAIWSNFGLFDFWFLTAPGSFAADTCVPDDWLHGQLPTWADAVILVHKLGGRNCTTGRYATTRSDSYAVLIHEFSHAAFNLPDEYGYDGYYYRLPPVLYDSDISVSHTSSTGSKETITGCLDDGGKRPWWLCQEVPQAIGGVQTSSTSGYVSWWRSEGGEGCIMQTTEGTDMPQYGRGDWELVRQKLVGLSAGPVVDPSVWPPITP